MGRKCRLAQTRIEQNKDHTQIMREIQFRSSFNKNNSSNVAQFTEYVLYFVQSHKTDYITGDFNENALFQSNPSFVLSLKRLY